MVILSVLFLINVLRKMTLKDLLNLSLRIIKITIFAVLVILIAPGVPPDVTFQAYQLTPPRPLEGALAPNKILDKAVPIPLDRAIEGPESIAVRGDEIYTGIIGGEVIRIKNGKVTTITTMGEKCEGKWDVLNCGRPCGVRFNAQGKLVVADAAKGIFEVDVDTGHKRNLLSLNDPIEGKMPRFPDDFDIDSSGNIYWSDASTNANIVTMLVELVGPPSARLVKTDPKTKTSTVLIDNLHFSNGVQLSKNEDFVMVSETMRGTIWRYFLKGPRKGEKELFVDGLPGMPDNIRPNGKGTGYYVALSTPRLPNPGLADILGPLPLVRKFILRVHYLAMSLFEILDNFFPTIYFKQIRYYISHLGPIGALESLPKEVIIVEIDENGNILSSLFNSEGPLSHTSEVNVGPSVTYFASPSAPYIWKMNTKDLQK